MNEWVKNIAFIQETKETECRCETDQCLTNQIWMEKGHVTRDAGNDGSLTLRGTRWGVSYVETTTGWVHGWRGRQRRVPVVSEWRDRCRWDRGPIASWRELRSVVHWRTDGLQLLWSFGACGWVLLKPWGTKDTVGSKPNAWSMTELDCGHQLHHMSPGVV